MYTTTMRLGWLARAAFVLCGNVYSLRPRLFPAQGFPELEFIMARGWESKSVEQQQEEMAERRNSIHSSMSADDQQRDRRRQGLLLSRQRLRQQLQTACNPRHREMLEQSLAELESQLASFDQASDPTAPK